MRNLMKLSLSRGIDPQCTIMPLQNLKRCEKLHRLTTARYQTPNFTHSPDNMIKLQIRLEV